MQLYKAKMIILSVVLFIGIGFLPQISLAQSQTAMNMEAYKAYKKSDVELNSVYQSVLKRYASETDFIKKFKAAQRIWIQLRDAELAAKYPDSSTSGSGASMCQSVYLESLTKERIKFLKVWITGIPDGDVCAGSVGSM